MSTILKWFKKRRLIKKYKFTDKKMSDQVYLLRMMKDDKEFCDYYRHQIYCELRFLRRLKQL